jgi:hypothetical protein
VHDVSGLYLVACDNDPAKEGIKLIEPSVAAADAHPKAPPPGVKHSRVTSLPAREPKNGLWFKALRVPGSENGRNPDRFAIAAFPAKYQKGQMTFIVNEEGTQWKKDLGGLGIDVWPNDPPASGWQKMD